MIFIVLYLLLKSIYIILHLLKLMVELKKIADHSGRISYLQLNNVEENLSLFYEKYFEATWKHFFTSSIVIMKF